MSARPLETAQALRAAFDGAFAAAPPAGVATRRDFIVVRIEADEYAVAVDAITGLHVDRKIVPLPTPQPYLLGLVAVRGILAPAYDLRALVGYAAGPQPRWLVFARGATPAALAFDGFETHLRVAPGDVAAGGEHARRCIGGTVRCARGRLPLIDVAAVLGQVTQPKEL